jgi:hypothetical protein
MPDFSMCRGKDCDKKETCLRFTAIPDKEWQSYVFPDPKDCKEYLPVKE